MHWSDEHGDRSPDPLTAADTGSRKIWNGFRIRQGGLPPKTAPIALTHVKSIPSLQLYFMPICTTSQPFVFWRNAIFAILCLFFGLWGWYDYSVKIPNLEKDCAAIEIAKEEIKKFETKEQTTNSALDASDKEQWNAAKKVVEQITARNSGAPVKPSAYDLQIQLWLYIIGCGVLGTPYFIWPIIQIAKKKYVLQENGTLITPEGTFSKAQISEIDMSRWCAKEGDRRSTWTATLATSDGKRIVLDDHDFKNMHLIIGAIAHGFMPDIWTAEGKRVGEQTPNQEPVDSANQNASDSKSVS